MTSLEQQSQKLAKNVLNCAIILLINFIQSSFPMCNGVLNFFPFVGDCLFGVL